MLTKGQFSVTGTKKAIPQTVEVEMKMGLNYPRLMNQASANYFVEIQDDLLTNTRFTDPSDTELTAFNERMLSVDKQAPQKIGLAFMGRQAPGGNNVVDGLLRYQSQRSNVELVGFINGADGLVRNDFEVMTRENLMVSSVVTLMILLRLQVMT